MLRVACQWSALATCIKSAQHGGCHAVFYNMPLTLARARSGPLGGQPDFVLCTLRLRADNEGETSRRLELDAGKPPEVELLVAKPRKLEPLPTMRSQFTRCLVNAQRVLEHGGIGFGGLQGRGCALQLSIAPWPKAGRTHTCAINRVSLPKHVP